MAKQSLPLSTGELPPSKARQQIIDESKRLEESTLYSYKAHHNAAAWWGKAHLWLGLPTTVLSALVGAASFAQLAKQNPDIALVAGCISITISILSGIITFLNPNRREAGHLSAANSFQRLHDEARVFWSVQCLLEKSEVVLTAKLVNLNDRKNDLNTKSPQIPRWAYDKAKAGIEAGEADFEVDRLNQSAATGAIPAAPEPTAEPAAEPDPGADVEDSSAADKPAS